MTGTPILAAAAVVVADGCLLVACWRRRSVLGVLCALTGAPLAAFALAAGLNGATGQGALIISIVVPLIGIVLLGLGQTVQRLLDQEPEEGVYMAVSKSDPRKPIPRDERGWRVAPAPDGRVGADLANLCNEAALLAARRDHHTVQTNDFTDTLEKILLGAPRGIILSPADRERTAYHEAGHALVGMLTPGADPVRKVSIIPRGAALGVTLSTPDDDQVSYTREDLLGKIKVALGGRVAEEIVFGTITTGAESDIEQVTAIARQMVGRWGMSDTIGFVKVLSAEGRGPFSAGAGETSEAIQRMLDEEVHQLVETAHGEVTAKLTGHRDWLETLARALLEHETLDELDAYAAAQMPPQPQVHAEAGVSGTTSGLPAPPPPSDPAKGAAASPNGLGRP